MLAVNDLHRTRGIVHRDIKPENILISYQGHAKLIDFGFGKLLGRDPQNGRTRTILGTIAYQPPEAILNQEYDARAFDCWSLGVTFFEMQARRCPWARLESPFEVAQSVMS